MRRSVFDNFQKDILCFSVQNGAIREDIDLSSPLIRQDACICNDASEHIDGNIFVVGVNDSDHVWVDIFKDFSAIRTNTAGLVRAAALQSGGGELCSSLQISLPAEHNRMAQRIAVCGFADTLGELRLPWNCG